MSTAEASILVLCTGNSCRSQMAAAYLERFAGDRFTVASAGTEPADEIHPLTLRVMAEDGIDLTGRRPQGYERFRDGEPLDYLVTVCAGAARNCPTAWPGVARRVAWRFDDPAALEGTESEILEGFRRVRDEIKDRCRNWAATRLERAPAVPVEAP